MVTKFEVAKVLVDVKRCPEHKAALQIFRSRELFDVEFRVKHFFDSCRSREDEDHVEILHGFLLQRVWSIVFISFFVFIDSLIINHTNKINMTLT